MTHYAISTSAEAQHCTARQMNREVTELLWKLGIPINLKGYHYLREAVMRSMETMSIHSTLNTQLYPYIAKLYNTTPSCVERNIRSAIETAWQRGNLSAAASLFGRSFNLTYDKPTNSEMIALLTEKLRMDLYM